MYIHYNTERSRSNNTIPRIFRYTVHTVYSENVSDNFERLLTRVAVGVDFLRLCHFGVAAILLLGFVVFCDSALIRFVTLRVMTNVANWVLSLYRLGERANKLTLFTLHDNWTIFCQFAAEEQKSVTALTACLHYTNILSFFHTSIFRDIYNTKCSGETRYYAEYFM